VDLFPVPPSNRYAVGGRPYTVSWLCRWALRRVTGRHILAEQILRNRNARLLHAHFGPIGWWALPLKKALGLPILTTFYGYEFGPSAETLLGDWPRRRQELFDKGDLFLVEGPFMQHRLTRLGCRREKVQIQRVAIDLRQTPFRPRKLRSDNKVIVIFAGRFVEKKGLTYALQAVRDVRDMGFGVEFRIIGDGPLADQVYALIRENKLERDVRLFGFLDYHDYLREMREADILLQPSVTAASGDSEGGAPTTLLEAQALGMPVISTYHADIPNVVLPGRSAILVPERNSEALASAMAYLMGHPSMWEEMGRNGRDFVERFHDIDKERPALEDKYFSLLGHSPAEGEKSSLARTPSVLSGLSRSF